MFEIEPHQVKMAVGILSVFLVITYYTIAMNKAEDGSFSTKSRILEIRMPGARISKTNVELCHAVQLNSDEPTFITGYEPLAHSSVVHHATLSACEKSGRRDEIWNCGPTEELAYPRGNICEESNLSPKIYNWALHGKGVMLPPGVAFPVGVGTVYRSIVLRIHYNHTFQSNVTINDDTSGFKVFFTTTKPTKLMGILMMTSTGVFQPNRTEHCEAACSLPIVANEKLHLFAYRVHTHGLGLMVTGYRVRNGTWAEIGRRSPQLPQSYISTNTVVTQSDLVAVRCTMFNFRPHVVHVGPKHEDEMCVFYAWFYTESGSFIPQLICASGGPPNYYWHLDKRPDLQNAPEEVVSTNPLPCSTCSPMD